MVRYGLSIFFRAVSDDLNYQFNTSLVQEKIVFSMAFSTMILQACAWPLSQTIVSNFAIPQMFEKALSQFEAFYSNRFSGRKLTWLHHLSNGDVKLQYTKKVYTVVMGTYSISIILLFETNDELSYEQIQVGPLSCSCHQV